MRFIIENEYQSKHTYKEIFVLKPNKWNDYWYYYTLYTVYYYDNKGDENYVGEVKIGEKNNEDLPKEFENLSDDYFSVGQSKDYYSNLYQISEKYSFSENILKLLNDLVERDDLLIKYKDNYVLNKSLLRSVTINEIRNQFTRVAKGDAELTDYDFTYIFPKDSSEIDLEKIEMEFKVKENSLPPTNIHVLIGRNGTGKTRLFNDLTDLFFTQDGKKNSGLYDYSTILKFKLNNPYKMFSSLIYVSYSAFDQIKHVNNINEKSKRYFYLGLKRVEYKENGDKVYQNKDPHDFDNEFSESIGECCASKYKREKLKKAIHVLESDPIFKEANFMELLDDYDNESIRFNEKETAYDEYIKRYKDIFSKLSTGHKIVMLIITKLVETVEEKSLVLLDEPETHLHPPLLSSFIRALSELLISRNAVAIIATHSPVILQEVPKSCVWILNRSDTISNISRPDIETFGESYSKIVNRVFGFEMENSGYHQLIEKEVRKTKNYEDLNRKFNGQIGKEAEIIARTAFLLKEKGEKE